MKRLLAVILIVGLILCLSAMPALAEEPAQSYNVSGVIQAAEDGTVSGTLTDNPDAPVITLTVSGVITDFADHTAELTGTVSDTESGAIEGDLKADINDVGVATLSGEITGKDVRWWISGYFPKSVADGQFVGKVSAVSPENYVSDITVDTETGDDNVEVGKTLQMTARVEPSGASDKVAWSVQTADGSGAAEIDMDTGLLTGKQVGIVTVTAKALDGSLKHAEMQVTVTEPVVTATPEGQPPLAAPKEEPSSAAPSYVIDIPGKVDFGTLQKGTGVKTQPFTIEVKDAQIDEGEIRVRVSSTFRMTYKDQFIPFTLWNSEAPVTDGEIFAVFTGSDQEENGRVNINTASIVHSGNYTGIMTFIITYENDGN
jgi:hypothetical protein